MKEELRCYGLAAEAFLRHSELVATLTMAIAHDRRYPSLSAAYAAGLLHDIGKVVLNDSLQRRTPAASLEAYMLAHGCSLAEAEQQTCGATHAELGRHLAVLWGLPRDVTEAIANHQTALDEPDQSRLALYVRLANQVACRLDPCYPAVHRPVELALPDWLDLEQLMSIAKEQADAPDTMRSSLAAAA